MTNEEVKKLASDHWSYVESVISAHTDSQRVNPGEEVERAKALRLCEFHYVTAFVHGWKHGMAEAADRARSKKLKSSEGKRFFGLVKTEMENELFGEISDDEISDDSDQASGVEKKPSEEVIASGAMTFFSGQRSGEDS